MVYWVIITVVYSMVLITVLNNFGLPGIQILVDLVVNNVLVTGSCLLIAHNMRYYLPRHEKYWYLLTVSLALSAISYWGAKGILYLLFSRDARYSASFAASAGIRFGITFLLIGCVSMISLLWYTQEEQQAMLKRKADAEKLEKEAELFKLRRQLQPHFLFNSLNSISSLITSQPEKARHMIQQLSDFLRGSLKKDEQQWNTLEEEFQYLRLYLDIEKVRFGHRLQTEIRYPPDVLSWKLPSMLLQPVMENAIKFGLYDTTEEVLISLEAMEEEGYLKIVVTNPFDPQTSQPLKGTGFGLSSIKRRLYLLFSRNDLLQTSREGNQFFTTLLIPKS